MTSEFAKLRERGNLSATRLLHLAHPLLTYVRSNKSAIINYGARYRSGRRIATALAESGVNSLVARRMVKRQQMQWSKRGAHLLLQVRAAVLNGDLGERLTYKPPKQAHRSRIAWLFEPNRRCSRRPNTPANLSVPCSARGPELVLPARRHREKRSTPPRCKETCQMTEGPSIATTAYLLEQVADFGDALGPPPLE